MSTTLQSQAHTTSMQSLLSSHHDVRSNLDRASLITQSVEHRNAIIAESGALATWNPAHSTGRIPNETYMVRHEETADTIDWTAAACIAMTPALFDSLLGDALAVLRNKERIYELDRCIGADADYAMPTKLITDNALSTLFADNMFRALPDNISDSIFADAGFTIICVPHDYIDNKEYGKKQVVAMDFDRRIGLIYGSSYCGCIKKMMFTVMNYLLPEHGILPLHCSANEANDGSTALFLGLSGTGKTTISNVPDRKLIGDDEMGWSNEGIANFENGCYAKLINLDPSKEPQIFDAVFKKRPFDQHGSIIENAMVYPNGVCDLNDGRIAENSRASYPLTFLSNVKEGQVGTHPKTIIFLTADAAGILPPIAKLSPSQAMLWFMMGYTSKLAGTEQGITAPKAAFSRFFGAPFMPCPPAKYAALLKEKMESHGTQVYLVNTGWSGGAYGTGERMDISITRAVTAAALDGSIVDVEYTHDARFHLDIPTSCPSVDDSILQTRNTWTDAASYDEAADTLAKQFAAHFQKEYGQADLDPAIAKECPGL
ncbi:MAG: phosphoenolpyruvate carboxykinase (ATP) [bacterium]|nr:phosphoenolpyruvate carboxykinase (ATP) [bacterium]